LSQPSDKVNQTGPRTEVGDAAATTIEPADQRRLAASAWMAIAR
jgi:hypothetical protein